MIVDTTTQMFDELRKLILELGKDGGILSPSIYDTAQHLRLYPPAEGVEPGLDWLLDQQQRDGGWGDPAVPNARDVPTLAAILALHKYRSDRVTRDRIQAGLDFLVSNAVQWEDVHIDALPIAAEIILPYLLDEAEVSGLKVRREPYARLLQFGQKKLAYLRQTEIRAGMAPAYSWEAYGNSASVELLDETGGVGHSPAATAAWLRVAMDHPEMAMARARAERYLANAHQATGTDIPGVVPVAYPISVFEMGYGLYALLITGLLDHPALQDEIQIVLDRLSAVGALDNAFSFSEYFVQDMDDTAVSVSVLENAGYQQPAERLQQFWNNGHYYTFKDELNPSVFSNAHALHAMRHRGERVPSVETFLIDRQLTDGSWCSDKWHSWWRYTTVEVVISLVGLGYEDVLQRAAKALIRDQNEDGSWNHNGAVSPLATAYTMTGLHVLDQHHLLDVAGKSALQRGTTWLAANPNAYVGAERDWLGKEVYAPRRVDRAYWLSIWLARVIAQDDVDAVTVPSALYSHSS